MTVIELVAARSWKAVELFGSLRLCVSHFYLRLLGVPPSIETNFIATPAASLIIEPFKYDRKFDTHVFPIA